MPAAENRPSLGSWPAWPRSPGFRFTSLTNCKSEGAARCAVRRVPEGTPRSLRASKPGLLILNDEHLDEKARQEFETHLEKVADISLVYEPTPILAAAIGAGGAGENERFVTDRCVALGITNIRTIKRVGRLVRSVESKLVDFDPEVLRTAIQSLVLFCWCRDEPEEAPSLDYVETKKLDLFGLGRSMPANKPVADQIDDKQDVSRWSARMQAYGYIWTDDFDLVLIGRSSYARANSIGAWFTTRCSLQE